MMRKLEGVSLTAVLAMSAALAGCDEPATRICVDAKGVRVVDSACVVPQTNTTVDSFHWRYYGGGAGAPAIGAAALGGSDIAGGGETYHAAPDGGIARGGFGGMGGDEGGGE